MNIRLNELPVITDAPGMKMQMLDGLGGMAVTYWETGPMPATPDLFKGLPNDSCPCPHWGYMLKGSMHIKFDSGEEMEVHTGEVFYFESGHTGWIEKEAAWVEFSPENEFKEVMAHVGKKMQELGQ
jgi:hypothetical protein